MLKDLKKWGYTLQNVLFQSDKGFDNKLFRKFFDKKVQNWLAWNQIASSLINFKL